jgi:hypothetical protein
MLQSEEISKAKLILRGYDRGEPLWDAKSVNLLCAKDILNGNNFFQRKTKHMTEDLNKATVLTNECLETFNFALNQLLTKEKEISESSKKVSGNIRKSANELAEGLIKLEKTVNFQNLERYVGLLERAATTLETLAQLEKNGDLTKIIGALK